MPIYSHSRIISYEACPLRYKCAYIDKIKPETEETAESFLGARVHEALERLYRNIWYGKKLTKKELLTFFRSQWVKSWPESIILVDESLQPAEYRQKGEAYLKDYYKRYKPFREGRIVDLEITDYLFLDEKKEYEYYIRIDRLMDMGNGLYEIHDYKTNATLPTQEQVDKDPQLAMYSLWVRREFENCREVRLVWHFLAFDKEMDSYRNEEQLDNLRQETLKKIKVIEEATEFPARVSDLCLWCLYKRSCPEGSSFQASAEALNRKEKKH
jgi:putative RecB family exonuclease